MLLSRILRHRPPSEICMAIDSPIPTGITWTRQPAPTEMKNSGNLYNPISTLLLGQRPRAGTQELEPGPVALDGKICKNAPKPKLNPGYDDNKNYDPTPPAWTTHYITECTIREIIKDDGSHTTDRYQQSSFQ